MPLPQLFDFQEFWYIQSIFNDKNMVYNCHDQITQKYANDS